MTDTGAMQCSGTTPHHVSRNLAPGFSPSVLFDPADGPFRTVAVGGDDGHSCAIRVGGQLVCVGSNKYRQAEPPEGMYRSVSVGEEFSCGVTTDGALLCWGRNHHHATKTPDGVYRSVSSSGDYSLRHSCAVRVDSKIVCWGNGRLDPPDYDFRTVDVTDRFACGVRTNGTVACWGEGYGGSTPSVSAPPNPSVPPEDRNGSTEPPEGQFVAVAVGEQGQACGVRANGKIACWGNEGITKYAPTEGRFTAVGAGWRACALRDDGKIVCW